MTHAITLDPETEAAIEKRAARRGISVADYMAELAAHAVRPRLRVKTGAEVLAELQAEGILTGYGDPSISSAELARELRAQVSQSKFATRSPTSPPLLSDQSEVSQLSVALPA